MGFSFFFKVLQNSYQKTGMFFGKSGSRNIRKQIIFFLTIPPAIFLPDKESCEKFSSVNEIRGGSRMERRLTDGRGGGKRRKDKKATRNGGVEEAGNFKKNGPILYYSRSDYLLMIFPVPLPDSFIRFVKVAF